MKSCVEGYWAVQQNARKVIYAGPLIEVWDYLNPTYIQGVRPKRRIKELRFKRMDNMLRARSRVARLIYANMTDSVPFFFTATFSEDVKDYDTAVETWKKFRRILVHHFPKIRYVCVPELQKNGRWHFHAVLYSIGTIDELRLRFGKRLNRNGIETDYYVFKFTELWTQANGHKLETGNYDRASISPVKSKKGIARYIVKYLTKETGAQIPSDRKSYFAGGKALKRPIELTFLPDDPFADLLDLPAREPDYEKTFESEHAGPMRLRRYLNE